MDFSVVTLAAGEGRRMHGNLPKVLNCIAGTPILERILDTTRSLSPERTVVVIGHQANIIKDALRHQKNIVWALQHKQLGTGHAVLQALPHVGHVEYVLIIHGDVPLISADTLKKLIAETEVSKISENSDVKETQSNPLTIPSIGMVTMNVKNPFGLGRIVRNQKNEVIAIVEEKDATKEQKKISEICSGIFLAPKSVLERWLPLLETNNAQQEYYITDIIKHAVEQGVPIKTVSPIMEFEVMGVNDKAQLASLERIFQHQQALQFMRNGLTLLDPYRFDLRGNLEFGDDVIIDVNVVLEGDIRLGNNVSIGPNVYLKNAEIHDGTTILANTVIEGANIAAGCSIGPFARIRPGTELGGSARVGNFVEIKNAKVGMHSKINHLSYIGDATLGQDVNIGAGTITCNYDGKDKHHTWIGDRVSIGSDTQLIAPVRVGDDATIGAGTTVVRDVEPHELIHNKIIHRSIIKPKEPLG